ncbi:MAG: permease [Planctomycetota bacterium]
MLNKLSVKKLLVVFLIFVSLFGLLFQYRILSILKKLGYDVAPVNTKFSFIPQAKDIVKFPEWQQPFYYTLDYINSFWFALLLAILIGSASVVFLSGFIGRNLKGNGFRHYLSGMLMGLPNMFCSCCAVGIFIALRRAGASLGPALAFLLTAPTLNVLVLVFAFSTLPFKLVLSRLVLGLVVVFGVSALVAKLFPDKAIDDKADDIRPLPGPTGAEPIGYLLKQWLACTWDITKKVGPILVLWLFVTAVLFETGSVSKYIGSHWTSGFISTVLASASGTVMMNPFTSLEVVWVKDFVKHGMGTGPAVAILLTLPAVCFPALWIAGRNLKSWKIPATVAALVFVIGVIGGLVFSAI